MQCDGKAFPNLAVRRRMQNVASTRTRVYCVRRASRTNEPGDWLDGKAETPSREGYRLWKESTGIRRSMAGGCDSGRANNSCGTVNGARHSHRAQDQANRSTSP